MKFKDPPPHPKAKPWSSKMILARPSPQLAHRPPFRLNGSVMVGKRTVAASLAQHCSIQMTKSKSWILANTEP